MTIAELGAIGEFISSIVVMITLLYLSLQVRQNNLQQKREETISIQHGQNEVLAPLLNPAVSRAYAMMARDGRNAAVEDRAMATFWVIRYLNHFQIVYDLHKIGRLDPVRYALWEGWVISIVGSKGIREWWDEEDGKLGFMPEVRDMIDRKLDDTDNPPRTLDDIWSTFNAASWTH